MHVEVNLDIVKSNTGDDRWTKMEVFIEI